ncbi:unnamed protein product [Dovyalis caffra]|uniref:Peptidase metallopeptidase domain-containing protein n=1 Tax=Dovyalis caffra TaxID=77055 RepID=A0AAV1SKB7_9ROSI|nr:unnamed protein product [Dovyalis caffra]
MTSNTFYALAFACFLTLSFLSHTGWAHRNMRKESPYEFMKLLKGCKQGDNVEGIQQLKKFLHHFGYLNQKHLNNRDIDDDYFDESLESALKTYQLNFNLKPTGVLDTETVSLLMIPRCGVPDIVDGKTRMKSAGSYNIKYAHFPGSPRWPVTKKVLNWGLQHGSRRDVIEPLAKYSFQPWVGIAPFTFNFVDGNLSIADIKIGFLDKSQGMAGNTLGFTYPPTNGTVFFNADMNWSFGATPGAYDLGTVGLHEFGHALGLAHSSVEAAVMWPYTGMAQTKHLHDDDIKGMKALYAAS